MQALNPVRFADQRVIVILRKRNKIDGLRGKDSIFGQFLSLNTGKLTTSFHFLLKKQRLGLDRSIM